MNVSLAHTRDYIPESLIIPIANDEQLPAVIGIVAAQTGIDKNLLEQDFKAEKGDVHTLYIQNKKIFLLGLGEKPEFNSVLKAFRSFSHRNHQKLPAQIGISFLHKNQPIDPAAWMEAATNGLLLGTYQIGRFKTTNGNSHQLASENAEIVLLADKSQADLLKEAAQRGLSIAQTQLSIFDLVNAPANKKAPLELANWAVASGKKHGFSVKVFEKKEIVNLGLDALLAVNRGSEMPPVFIVMEYKPANTTKKDLKKIGLVGKGVTFDTGGLSIKPSTNMHFMKSDMGGAAAVLGTMEAATKLQLPIHLIGIVPSTDNSVDAMAIKPSDVINSYSGKTIEIIDTDAEGRLILADGLAYMVKHYQPDVLIDLATLTGSAVRTFGYHAAALFSNNDKLAASLYEISEKTGERVWRLPIWDLYKDDIKSDVADVRNFSGRPLAGAIGAAKFLEVFTNEHPCWAHLDIAGVAFNDSEFSIQKSATGFGIRLLTEFLNSSWIRNDE